MIRALNSARIKRMRKAVVLMSCHHRDLCEQEGDHPEEVDTLYSLAAEALEFHIAALTAKGADR